MTAVKVGGSLSETVKRHRSVVVHFPILSVVPSLRENRLTRLFRKNVARAGLCHLRFGDTRSEDVTGGVFTVGDALPNRAGSFDSYLRRANN